MAEILALDRERAMHFDLFWQHYMPMVEGKTDNFVHGAVWAMKEIGTMLNRSGGKIVDVPAESLAVLVARIVDGSVSQNGAKEIFAYMVAGEHNVDSIIKERGLKQMSDSTAIEKMVDDVIAANQKSVEEYKAGKEKALNALFGQVMKASNKTANPAQVTEILKKKLS